MTLRPGYDRRRSACPHGSARDLLLDGLEYGLNHVVDANGRCLTLTSANRVPGVDPLGPEFVPIRPRVTKGETP